MKVFEKYNVVLMPEIRYVTLPCDKLIQNINFDNILKEIGRYYFKKPEASMNRICAMIRDSLNAEWHLNRRRKRKKRVSATQIKTIRRSFKKITKDGDFFLRIPFDVVPILFYILNLARSIDNENSSIHSIFKEMEKMPIADYLYSYHRDVFSKEFNTRINNITDEVLICRYNKLNGYLTGHLSFMTSNYSDFSSHKLKDYKIQ